MSFHLRTRISLTWLIELARDEQRCVNDQAIEPWMGDTKSSRLAKPLVQTSNVVAYSVATSHKVHFKIETGSIADNGFEGHDVGIFGASGENGVQSMDEVM